MSPLTPLSQVEAMWEDVEPVDVDKLPRLPEGFGPLNREQHRAVTTANGPLLILAGAGSGKTRVLTRRIAYLIQNRDVAPEQILAVTFTNKAAAEMKNRVAELVGSQVKDLWITTFHSACVRILREDATRLGYTKRFAIVDDDDQSRLIRQLIKDHEYDPKQLSVRSVLSAIDRFKNQQMTPEAAVMQRRLGPHQPLTLLWEAYEATLRSSDSLDFNDLIGKTVELFQKHPDVLERWRERFHYVLVDEYQDTNRVQYELLHLLAFHHRNLAVVGDDDQSIYGFRGADVQNIFHFKQDFPEAKMIRMEQNYRCSPNILSLANEVVSHNPERIPKKLWTDAKSDIPVRLMCFENAHDEARAVTERITRLAHEEGRAWNDIAIIYRTNAMSTPFEMALRRQGIPCRVVGGRSFYSRREVRDTLAYLRLLTSPSDDAAFLRVVNVPARGIGAATLQKLREAQQEPEFNGQPLLRIAASANVKTTGSKALQGFANLIEELTTVARQTSVAELLDEVLLRTEYRAMVEAEDASQAEDRQSHLRTLCLSAQTFTPTREGLEGLDLVSDWLDQMALRGVEDEQDAKDAVILTTVHSAKGLEYPVVFVVQMVEGSFPHAHALESGEDSDIAEERRLAYVAFTRAKDRLYVTRTKILAPSPGPPNRSRPFERTERTAAPSRFLFGLPLEAISGDLPEATEPTPPVTLSRTRLEPQTVRAFREGKLTLPEPAKADAIDASSLDDLRLRPVGSWEDLAVGKRIYHEVYGLGEILDAKSSYVMIEFSRFPPMLRKISVPDPKLQVVRG